MVTEHIVRSLLSLNLGFGESYTNIIHRVLKWALLIISSISSSSIANWKGNFSTLRFTGLGGTSMGSYLLVVDTRGLSLTVFELSSWLQKHLRPSARLTGYDVNCRCRSYCFVEQQKTRVTRNRAASRQVRSDYRCYYLILSLFRCSFLSAQLFKSS